MKLGTDAGRTFLLVQMKQRLGGAVMEAHYELQRTRVQKVLPKHTKRESEFLSHRDFILPHECHGNMTAWKLSFQPEPKQ